MKGQVVDPDRVVWVTQSACRAEPEGGWSFTVGIPRSLVAMLKDTKPLLARPSVAKP
ncbi:MAG: hypothetical protein ABI551_04135 [Polyangiaceae bacterium]